MIFRRIPTVLYGYSCLFGLLFIAERYSKFLAVAGLQNPLRLHKNITLQLAYNRGISWSMLDNLSASAYHVLTGVIFLICCAIAVHTIDRYNNQQTILAELLVLVGAFSNVCDRIYYGAVVDFIALSYHGWHWPIFNLADCFIVCGLLGMLAQDFKRI